MKIITTSHVQFQAFGDVNWFQFKSARNRYEFLELKQDTKRPLYRTVCSIHEHFSAIESCVHLYAAKRIGRIAKLISVNRVLVYFDA